MSGSYSYSKFEGLQTNGPNGRINAEGRQTTYDRPHNFHLTGSYDIPKIEVQLAPDFSWFSGQPFAPAASIALRQGRQNIKIAPPTGEYRTPAPHLLSLRVSKNVALGSRARLEAGLEITNLLQQEVYQTLLTGTSTARISGSL